MGPPKVFFQGKIVAAAQAQVSVFDHGFLYGDGLYETVRAHHGHVHHWSAHYQRLKKSARLLQLKCPWSSAYLLQGIQKLLQANRAANASVRISVSRGPGPLGLDPSVCPEPTLVMLLHPERDVPAFQREGVSIGISHIRRNHPLCLDPQIKSTNSLNTIFAKMEGTQMGVFETVLLNLENELTEGTTTNLFFVKGKLLFTPALACGLLAGVTRAEIIRLARRAGMSIKEGRYTLDHLRSADEIFLTSTTLELVPVIQVITAQSHKRVVWRGRPGHVMRQLLSLYNAQMDQQPS